MLKILPLSIFLIFLQSSFAQEKRICSAPSPDLGALKELQKTLTSSQKSTELKVFPVVFHVLHEYGSENISALQIQNALEWLNRDFQVLNPDLGDVMSPFDTVIGNTNFEFRLATIDPLGNPTDGIDRIYTSLNKNATDLSRINVWDPLKYINIWTVSSIQSSGIAAFTTNPLVDDSLCNPGVVILHSYLGEIGTGMSAIKHFLTHEVAHYFGLFHLSENDNGPVGNNDCGYTDGIFDTPHQTNIYACFQGLNSCNDSLYQESFDYWGYDAPDNEENFLAINYCGRMFTKLQALTMRGIAESPLYNRSQLCTESNLMATGTLDSMVFIPFANANFIPQSRSVCAGDSLVLIPEMSNHSAQYQWSFPGGSPATSSQVFPKVAYSTPGFYDITLTVTTPRGSATNTISNAIYVSGNWAEFAGPTVQDFDAPPFWWFTNNPTTNSNQFELMPSGGVSNSGCYKLNNAWIDADTCPTANQLTGSRDYLISPAFDLRYTSNVSVYFDYAFGASIITSGSIPEVLKVYASRDCGKTWMLRKTILDTALVTALATAGTNFEPNANQWKTASFNYTISALDAKTRFRFEFESSNQSNNFYLDNFRIDGTLAVSENESAQVFISPNPLRSGSELRITSNLTDELMTVRIFDLSGKEVFVSQLAAKNQESLLSITLKSGMYLMRIQQGSTLFTEKICIE
jgi:hypothetical protein